jgi:hypothetical protein
MPGLAAAVTNAGGLGLPRHGRPRHLQIRTRQRKL